MECPPNLYNVFFLLTECAPILYVVVFFLFFVLFEALEASVGTTLGPLWSLFSTIWAPLELFSTLFHTIWVPLLGHGGTKRDLTKVGDPFGAHTGRFIHHAGRPEVAKV